MHPELNYSLQHYQREIVRGVEGLVSTGVKQLEVGEFGLIMHVFKMSSTAGCWLWTFFIVFIALILQLNFMCSIQACR
jgi:hypothetical protein